MSPRFFRIERHYCRRGGNNTSDAANSLLAGKISTATPEMTRNPLQSAGSGRDPANQQGIPGSRAGNRGKASREVVAGIRET